jgi:hypothetical protein
MKGILAAIAFMMIGIGTAAAAAVPRIPSSEAPGRERERFVDPPGARLLQPSQPSTVLPYGTQPFELHCRPRATHRKARGRKRC